MARTTRPARRPRWQLDISLGLTKPSPCSTNWSTSDTLPHNSGSPSSCSWNKKRLRSHLTRSASRSCSKNS
eukprot:2316280-Pyramimonas_sp.AAC.1